MQVLNSRGEVWSSAAKQTCQPFQLHSMYLLLYSSKQPFEHSLGKTSEDLIWETSFTLISTLGFVLSLIDN